MKSSAVFKSPSSPKFVLHRLDVAMPSLGLFFVGHYALNRVVKVRNRQNGVCLSLSTWMPRSLEGRSKMDSSAARLEVLLL